MIYEGSRYQDGTITPVLGSDGVYHSSVFPPVFIESDSVVVTQIQFGQDLTTLASIVYGDPELWWHIANANPSLYPDDFVPGTFVTIPMIDVTQ